MASRCGRTGSGSRGAVRHDHRWGGFASRAEAQKALARALARLGPNGRAATITLDELVDEYLELHQAERVTIAKLRWLLGKATAVLGEKRLADLSPKDVYAWRLTIPEAHRFEATQALRQVLNRAVDWGLLDSNPAKRGIRNTPRRAREKRPFESWQQLEAVAARLGPVTARWSSSPRRPGCGHQSCSGSSGATSTAPPVSCMYGARTRTGG
jgi:hypothetical protein